MSIIVHVQHSWEIVPDGIYSARLTSVHDKGDSILFYFETDNSAILTFSTPRTLADNFDLASVILALTNQFELPEGQIDLEELIGRSCTLLVSNHINRLGKPVTMIDNVC